MKYFIDTEFLEGTQNKRILGIKYGETKNTIDLISVGIVSEKGREFYEVSNEFNLKEAWSRFEWKHVRVSDTNTLKNKEYWIRENVLKPIFDDFCKLEEDYLEKQERIIGYALPQDFSFTRSNFKKLLKKYGKTNKEIAKNIRNFIMVEDINSGGQILLGNFYPYETPKPEFYTYYGAYDWVVFCWLFGKMTDLPKGFPMFSHDLKVMLDNKAVNCSATFNIGLKTDEEKIKFVKNLPSYPTQDKEHNALDDAKWNLELFKFLKTI